jgi:hypothetical protein
MYLLQALTAKSDAQVLASRLSACTSSGEGFGGRAGSVGVASAAVGPRVTSGTLLALEAAHQARHLSVGRCVVARERAGWYGSGRRAIGGARSVRSRQAASSCP